MKETAIVVGDRVLVRNDGVRGKCKLGDIWEDVPHIVVAHRDPAIPVFDVEPENQQGRRRRLHRNKLLPFMSLPVVREASSTPSAESTSSYSDVGTDEDLVGSVAGHASDGESTQRRADDCSSVVASSSDPSDVPRYVIPARRTKRRTKPPDRFSP